MHTVPGEETQIAGRERPGYRDAAGPRLGRRRSAGGGEDARRQQGLEGEHDSRNRRIAG